MERGGNGIGGDDEEAVVAPKRPQAPQQRYHAVESQDHAIVQMTTMEPGSSAAAPR